MGLLIVVGGPGGSGSSTIAKMLSRHYGLHYLYGGHFMREYAKQYGYESIGEFLSEVEDIDNDDKVDNIIDKKLLRASRWHDILIDSKSFAALATHMQIPTTAKIWLNASIEKRVRRTLHKQGLVDLGAELPEHTHLFRSTKSSLNDRYELDKERFLKLYNIDYGHPEKYNDIVIDSSSINAGQTLDLIIGKLGNVRD